MKRQLSMAVAILSLGAAFAGTARASCGIAPRPGLGLASPFAQLPWLQAPAGHHAAPAPKNAPGGPVVGLWLVTFTSAGQTFDVGFDQWHSDGTEILNDSAPPQPANGAGTICLGVYKQTGARAYQLTHPFWSFDENSNLVATGVISETVLVDPAGDSYHGGFTFDVYDLNGNLIDEVKGTLAATRITPD